MRRFSVRLRGFILATLLIPSAESLTMDSLQDAEASFNYIASTLQAYRSAGELANNPGIEAVEMPRFVALLEHAYQEFSRDFNSESAMCRFYRDPENGRMTIEERAEYSALYLRSLDARINLFNAANYSFQEAVVEQFDRDVLGNINEAKVGAVSNQRLPSSAFDEAALINFLDAMCR